MTQLWKWWHETNPAGLPGEIRKMEPNPYQSPTEAATEPPSPVQPTKKLLGPTLGLIALSGMMLCGCILWFLIAPLLAVMQYDSTGKTNLFPFQMVLWCSISVVPNSVILYGCQQARQGRRYRWALAAAILACIPILSPMMYCGIPFGIWLLLALRRQDVRACFTT